MKALATLKRGDGQVAELRPDGVWASADKVWAEMLNVRFNPKLVRVETSAGLPSYTVAVAAAAERYTCVVTYPWSDAEEAPGMVY